MVGRNSIFYCWINIYKTIEIEINRKSTKDTSLTNDSLNVLDTRTSFVYYNKPTTSAEVRFQKMYHEATISTPLWCVN